MSKQTDERAELKPCPFCGNVGIDFHEGSTFRWIVAECAKCGAQTGEVRVQTLGDGTPEEWMQEAKQDAIREWNTRALLAATPIAQATLHPDEFVCPLCFDDPANIKQNTLAATPAREWVGLTDKELWDFWIYRAEIPDGEYDSMERQFVSAARAIESALREKNAAPQPSALPDDVVKDAELIASKIMDNLDDRRGVLDDVDDEVRAEMHQTISEIIRAAMLKEGK